MLLKLPHFFCGNYFIGKGTYVKVLFMINKMKKQTDTMGTLTWIIQVQEDYSLKKNPQDRYEEKQDRENVLLTEEKKM